MQKVRDEKAFKKNAIKEKLKVKYYQDKENKLKVVLTLTKLLFIDIYFYKSQFFIHKYILYTLIVHYLYDSLN